MKCFITGYNGQLGYDIARQLEKRGEMDYIVSDITPREEILEKYGQNIVDKYVPVDITNREQIFEKLKEIKPDVIIHCAAFTAVDKAELPEFRALAHSINVNGPLNLVEVAKELDAKMIYISTDYVFDGKKGSAYTEEDKTCPRSVYGETKCLGEEAVREYKKHFIVRASGVFGINGPGNFVKTMIRLAENEQFPEISVVKDQIINPTYTVDLADLLVDMAESEAYGTYNGMNRGSCSWAELAEIAIKQAGLEKPVVSVLTSDYYAGKEMINIAVRPFNTSMDLAKTEKQFGPRPTVEDAIDRFLVEYGKKPIIEEKKM